MKKTKWYLIVLYIVIFIGIIGAFFTNVLTPFTNTSFWKDSNLTSLRDWSVIDSSENSSLITFPLPYSDENLNTICFKTEHCFVKVYAGNTLIYSFGDQKEIPLGHSPGRNWNVINIIPEYKNEIITINIICPYEKLSEEIVPFYYGSQGDIIQFIFRQIFPLMLISFVPFIFGIMLLLLSPIVYRESKTILFQTLAILMIDTSLWSLINSGFLQFYYGNAFGLEMTGYLTFILLPILTIVALRELGVIQSKKLFNSLFLIDTITFLITCILQLFNIVDFFITMPFVHLIMVVNATFYLFDYIKTLKLNKKKTVNIYVLIAFMFILIFSLFDILGNGFIYIYGMLIFIVFTSVWVVKKTLKLHYDNIEKATYKKIAGTDDLTGLGNRRSFNECLREKEYKKEKTTIIFIDLNCLKAVNDSKGHAFGDEYIIITSELIRKFEEKGASCFRIGGDEFCVLGSELDGDHVELLCSKINSLLEEQKDLFGISLSMSYGYSYYDPENDINIFQCLSRADASMYKNKNQCQNKS